MGDVIYNYELKIRNLTPKGGEVMDEQKVYVELPHFTGRNVPVTEIARAMQKDAQYVRVGLQQGLFNFGYAVKMEDSSEYNYYCPDRKVWEEIGYFNGNAEMNKKRSLHLER